MADLRDAEQRKPWTIQGNRRLFLQRVAAAGGGVLTGSAARGAPSKPPAPPARRTMTTKRPPPARTLTKATGKLTIGAPLRLSRSTGAGDTAQRPPPPTPRMVTRQPSTRQRALDAVSRAPGGQALLQRLGVGGRSTGGAFPSSGPLSSMVRLHTLAEAYAAGIALTVTGCQYAGRTYTGPEPIRYFTDSACASPGILREPRCSIVSYQPEVGPILTISLITPGTPAQTMTYFLELHAPGLRTDRVSIRTSGNPIAFTGTSDGTLVAVVELAGSSTAAGTLLRHLSFQHAVEDPAIFDFSWLNAIAL